MPTNIVNRFGFQRENGTSYELTVMEALDHRTYVMKHEPKVGTPATWLLLEPVPSRWKSARDDWTLALAGEADTRDDCKISAEHARATLMLWVDFVGVTFHDLSAHERGPANE